MARNTAVTLGKPHNNIKQGYFCSPEGMHLVFYIQKNNQIEIIGLSHQSMNIVEYLT